LSDLRFCLSDHDYPLKTPYTQLIFVDCHQDWCGVCDAVQPTLSRVSQDYDACDLRLTFCAASIAKLGDHIQKTFPSDSSVHLDKNGCLPVFALYRYKTCVGVISGVDAPNILSQIATNIPDKPVPVAQE
jgi:thiol-disulfide isomerase/thioredoxin